MVFADPVIASDGFIYEKAMLSQLLKNKQRSPMTREVLKSQYREAAEKKAEAVRFRERRSQELLAFAETAANPEPQMAAAAVARATDYVEILGAARAKALAT